MSTAPLTMPPGNQMPAITKEATQRATDAAKNLYQTISSDAKDSLAHGKEYAQQALEATRDAAQNATNAVKDTCKTVAAKAEVTLAQSKEYVHQHPLPVIVGALAIGLALGCMIGMAQRHEPTFCQRYLW
jgi:ElaB/YqjD/DUF883 family membrane-anchored ribosome-binding protein